MNYDDIFLFIKLINIGTFTELAKQINVSQSTVSRRIQNLEESTNTKLIKRNSRGLIEMTVDGKAVYESFNNIEVQANEALQRLINTSKEVEGTLKIGVPKLFFDNIIVNKLNNFYTRYPNVKLIFTYISKVNDLVKNDLDLAITSKPPLAQNCTVQTLVKAKNKLYASKKYISEKGMPKSIKDLKNHKIVGIADDNKCREALIGISEYSQTKEEVCIKPTLFLNNAMYDISLTTKCEFIINTLNIFIRDSEEIESILEEFYFDETVFYLIRNIGIRNNLEQEFVKFIHVCLQKEFSN
ncbi:LysR family transcriptional regulator [Francisella adeliensis]|uniref:LysR family transcriptional regulator n=1 Tax=Francisella adeliensis TaxID=2007306 RepID=A0A2Z4Y0B7_9GAMM|nr:LysR family transcriptional regulator [Francisella adeliensis]AXA34075.1 LysR family transcriptional regulator [Francisella adeliensis]MBK2085240.1 LysR family transcriptional regulator [Francisella adeliensis]MBK2095992.1 LysR family transcriptional regulator [Francisella adeliensis]QIW12315.1 LysR family transcriptional regulator [Francisella adeliensis]QIW14189.1 LysR family transcriptional regulator [Francisella adeliensis]